MAKTYKAIQTVTVGAAGSSFIEFTNIPQNYTDLKILLSARLSTSDVDNVITLNTSITSSNRKRLYANGTGSTPSSDSVVGGGLANASSYTANIFGSTEYYFPNYTGSTNKVVAIDAVVETNGANAYQNLSTQMFNLTSAITSIKLTPNSGTYVQYTTAYLYGVGGARATGGTITADGAYTYHTFTSSGTFIPLENIENAEALVIAGGGGGGRYFGGGGGAGGCVFATIPILSAATSYTTVIGSGGAAGTNASGSPGVQGINSSFNNYIATGGGFGNGLSTSGVAGGNGGSGGGAGGYLTPTANGGIGIQGQGNNGGNSNSGGGGGGGGGAGAAGTNSPGRIGAPGGAGVSTYSSWGLATSTGQNVNGIRWYAGGGGGSGDNAELGGNGGGGRGASDGTNGTAGTANTGGGGGGGSNPLAAWSGGSGLVIIRYPNT